MTNTDHTTDFEYGCGAVNSAFDIRDYTIKAGTDLPEEYETSKPTVKNQSVESSCVAYALSSVIEYHYTKLTKKKKLFSTEFIYGYREPDYYIGDGMMIRDALKTIQKFGDPFKTECGGNNHYKIAMNNVSENLDVLKDCAYPHRISTYVRLKTADEMKTSIMENGPIVVSMRWYKKYKLVENVYTYNPVNDYTHHCVLIYGWNRDGWLVQNSWGAMFGDGGRCIVPYTFKFNEAWGIIDNIDDTKLEVVHHNTTLIKKLYKVINVVVNSFMNCKYRVFEPIYKFIVGLFNK